MEVNRDDIERLYVFGRMTAKQIAVLYGYKSPQSVLNILKKYGIATRSGRDAQNVKEPSRELLMELYVDENLSCDEVAARLGIGDETVRRLLIRYGIPRRDNFERCAGWNKGIPMSAEQRADISGKLKLLYASGELQHWNNGNHWSVDVRNQISATLLGGRTPAPTYCGDDWRRQRTSCLHRDNYECQQCGSREHLEVHHWEPYRFSFDNSLENLVTLCVYCHDGMHATYRSEGWIAQAESEMYG